MLTKDEFNNLLNENIYYFKENDIVQPITNKKLKATLININGKEFWVPNKAIRRIQIYNKITGELLKGYLVTRNFLKQDRRKRYLRKADLDYNRSGDFVELNKGWAIYAPKTKQWLQ